jgi:hypothetical protein
LPSLLGSAGEIYLQGGAAFVVFKESRVVSGQSEIVAVLQPTTTPSLGGTLNIPGKLVASRLLGNVLYLVTNDGSRTVVSSVALADATRPALIEQRLFAENAQDVHATDSTLYVAQRINAGTTVVGTRVRLVGMIQLYLDLAAELGRGREQAEFLRKERIRF